MIITQEIEINLNGQTVKYWEDKGYIIPRREDKRGRTTIPKGTKIKVKVLDLPVNSNAKVDIKCDGCGVTIKNVLWTNYTRSVHSNGKYYCTQCVRKLFNPESIRKGRIKNGENSIAKYIIDTYGENGIELYWSKKNIRSPWDVSKGSQDTVWIKCQDTDYHEDYGLNSSSFTRGDRCPCCSHKGGKVHPWDSLGYLFPEVFDIWSDKNDTSPFEYTPYSSQYVWWKCPDSKHLDFKRRIKKSDYAEFRCPDCQFSKGEKRIEEYLLANHINYIPQREFDGLLGLGFKNLSYDFHLPECNILIEFQGIQHEKYIKGMHKSVKDFEKQVLHDRRKKEYAEKHNIVLLEIWYPDYDCIETILSQELNKINIQGAVI